MTHALALLLLLAAAPAERLEALPAGEGIHVHVGKRGLFSAFGHDHDFEVTRWRGTAEIPGGDPARASIELALDAGSLHDREKGLSDGDRRKVDAQTAGPEVLDAAHAPEITFRSERVSVDAGAAAGPVRGTVRGLLTIRGRTRPVDATFEAAPGADGGWTVRGRARFRQSDFGVRPISAAGGTVGVKDEVEITFAIALRPAKSA